MGLISQPVPKVVGWRYPEGPSVKRKTQDQ
jgi:hypothetical protein